jgi:hypothetical protein
MIHFAEHESASLTEIHPKKILPRREAMKAM